MIDFYAVKYAQNSGDLGIKLFLNRNYIWRLKMVEYTESFKKICFWGTISPHPFVT